MPRKPLPPPPIFRLEGLSDGIDRRAVDDFTGLPLETEVRPVTLLPETVRAAAERERSLLLRDKLTSVGITKHGYHPPDKPEPEPTKPFKRRL